MNTVITFFQGLASHVPDLLQPFIIALAGAVPFVEGEVSAVIGVWAGLNPIVAGFAGAIGNFICVTVIVLLGARAREAVVARRSRARESVSVGVGAAGAGADAAVADEGATVADERGPADGEARFLDEPPAQKKPESKGRIKFKRFLNRFGVPGASLLGPLAIPTQITSTILVSSGVKTSWILLWQGIAIVVWTTLTTLIATGALSLFTG
ncbi:small multidrug efflux protein [Brevibacterium aurantiacum]|uniref:Small multidrug efflux protein n=1 Tax=Brevibacterium aurantiacum TaxID=273384 RepID=A0A2A3ZTX4_BREAU|nr:small multidrug efflux protein [Brevibacterium aurantiacum]PCC55130.1 small multidrug efflux protein [Brevibacterium aurantiacum]